jgi:hypothetical protein
MKKYLAVLASVVLLAGCAAPATTDLDQQLPEEPEQTSYPTPQVLDNRVPKTCQLDGLINLANELAMEEVVVDPNPVNRQNSNEQNYQDYLDGRYLVCAYRAESTGKALYSIWRESPESDWLDFTADLNEDLEPGEGVFEQVSLGLGELAAYYLLEASDSGGFFTGHTFIDGISVVVFTELASTATQGHALMKATLEAMP